MFRGGNFAICFSVFLLSLGGCDNADAPKSVKTYAVKGKVELGDGKPLTGGKIFFISPTHLEHVSVGEIQPDGTFELETAGSGKGAPSDSYRVRIDPPEMTIEEAKSKMKKRVKGKPVFPTKYMDEDESGLTAVVKPEPNQLEPFRLK